MEAVRKVAGVAREVGVSDPRRDECLNAHWFATLADARTKIEAWRQDYNEQRPLAPHPHPRSTRDGWNRHMLKGIDLGGQSLLISPHWSRSSGLVFQVTGPTGSAPISWAKEGIR